MVQDSQPFDSVDKSPSLMVITISSCQWAIIKPESSNRVDNVGYCGKIRGRMSEREPKPHHEPKPKPQLDGEYISPEQRVRLDEGFWTTVDQLDPGIRRVVEKIKWLSKHRRSLHVVHRSGE